MRECLITHSRIVRSVEKEIRTNCWWYHHSRASTGHLISRDFLTRMIDFTWNSDVETWRPTFASGRLQDASIVGWGGRSPLQVENTESFREWPTLPTQRSSIDPDCSQATRRPELWSVRGAVHWSQRLQDTYGRWRPAIACWPRCRTRSGGQTKLTWCSILAARKPPLDLIHPVWDTCKCTPLVYNVDQY